MATVQFIQTTPQELQNQINEGVRTQLEISSNTSNQSSQTNI